MRTEKTGDPFGRAITDFYCNRWRASKINVESNISTIEKISPSYLFRNYKNMPAIEKEALEACTGRVLDVGACAGSHSLYLQQERGLEVKAIDISPGCCEVMKKRGVKNVECVDFYKVDYDEKYDTILLLMNGIGISGTLVGLEHLLKQAKKLMVPGGKVLFDSSDIDYAFYEKDGSKWVNLNSNYYGEVQYKLTYKKEEESAFNWLFIDPDTMDKVARESGFKFTLLKSGKHYDYLGELRIG